MGISDGQKCSSSRLELRHEDGVATVEFELAQAKNSFRADDLERLSKLVDEALAVQARCLVLRGAGGSFSAGWDVASIDPGADDPIRMIGNVVGPFLRKLRDLPMPTISGVSGPALGFGLGLALSCDLCIAEEEARFGSPFRHIGMVPDSGTHFYLLSRLGHAVAAELIYTGRLISGAEAARLGLINRSVVAGTVAREAQQLAQGIASGPTVALRLSKEILLAGEHFDASIAHEALQLGRAFATADLAEGVRAFQERRKPVFQGR